MEINGTQLIHVAIVDDHKVVAEVLGKIINESGIASVTDTYYDLESCRKGLKEKMPDILLLDIELPDGDGVDFCAEIRTAYPELKVVMLTAYNEYNIAGQARDNGACGYILKHADSTEILAGIKAVSRGEEFMCKGISLLIEEKKDQKVIWFTDRELEILSYLAKGYTTSRISSRLSISAETVKKHRRNMLIKTKSENVAELIAKAYEMRLIKEAGTA